MQELQSSSVVKQTLGRYCTFLVNPLPDFFSFYLLTDVKAATYASIIKNLGNLVNSNDFKIKKHRCRRMSSSSNSIKDFSKKPIICILVFIGEKTINARYNSLINSNMNSIYLKKYLQTYLERSLTKPFS